MSTSERAPLKLPLVISLMATYFHGWVLNSPLLSSLSTLGLSVAVPTKLQTFVGEHNTVIGAAFKAIPVATIAVDVVSSGPRSDYRSAIAAGLVLSSFGDAFLHFGPTYFNYGLLSFLAAQLMYTRAFASLGSRTNWTAAGIIYSITGIVYGKVLWPVLEASERGYVAAYLLAIATMLYKSLTSNGRRSENRDGNGKVGKNGSSGKGRSWWMSVVGAGLFVSSDLILVRF